MTEDEHLEATDELATVFSQEQAAQDLTPSDEAVAITTDGRTAVADDEKPGVHFLDLDLDKVWAKNRLRAQDIHKIVDVFNKRLEVPKYARRVPFAEIEQNEFNLNLSPSSPT